MVPSLCFRLRLELCFRSSPTGVFRSFGHLWLACRVLLRMRRNRQHFTCSPSRSIFVTPLLQSASAVSLLPRPRGGTRDALGCGTNGRRDLGVGRTLPEVLRCRAHPEIRYTHNEMKKIEAI